MHENPLNSFLDIASSGFQIASDQIVNHRKEICRNCSFWDCDAWNGLGKCNKCGCTGLKLKMAASKCPIGLWASARN